jgi:hypothetical protein
MSRWLHIGAVKNWKGCNSTGGKAFAVAQGEEGRCNGADKGLGADSRLLIRHNEALTDDEIIFAVEAFRFDAAPVTAERRNRGFTLIHVETGPPIARLRPVKGHDGLFDNLDWLLWKEHWIHFGPFGRTTHPQKNPLAYESLCKPTVTTMRRAARGL